MGEPAKAAMDPESWDPDKGERALSMRKAIDAGETQWTGTPEKLQELRDATDYYQEVLDRKDPQAYDAWRQAKQVTAQRDAMPAGVPQLEAQDAEQAPAPEQSVWEQFASMAGPAPRNSGTSAYVGSRRLPSEKPGLSPDARAADYRSAVASADTPSQHRATGRGVGAPLVSDAQNAARIAGQGATLRGGDEMAAYGFANDSTLLPQPGTPNAQRATGRGVDAPLMDDEQKRQAVYEEFLRSEQGANDTARTESPVATGLAEAGGALPMAVATAPLFGAAGAASRGLVPSQLAARNAAQGGAMGGAAGALGAQDGERLEGALVGAGTGAIAGGAASAAGASMGTVAKGVGEARNALAGAAQKAGLRNRAAATGVYGGQLAQMSKQRGRDIAERIGGVIEKYGAHKRPESSALPGWVPQGAGVYADTTEEAMNAAGRNMAGAVDDATAAGATVPAGELAMRLRGVQAEHLAPNLPDGRAIAGGIDDVIEQQVAAPMAGRAGAGFTPRELFDKRQAMKGMAKLDGQRNVMPETGYQGQAYRESRDVIRDAMTESMGPEQAARFGEANTDYGLLKMANNASRQREAQELGNQMASINSPGMAAAGSVLAGAPGAIAGIGAMETVKRVGRDAMADGLGGAARALRVPEQAVATAPARYASGMAPAGTDLAPQGADRLRTFADFIGEPSAAAEEPRAVVGNKHPLSDPIANAPEGTLGQWTAELQEAQQQGSKELGVVLLRLSKDPAFMRGVYPQLTAARRGTQETTP